MAVDTMGDVVNITDDERLDKPDFTAATSTLIQATVAKVLGALVGSLTGTTSPFMGCVSAPSTSWDNGTKFLTINGATFYQGGAAASPTSAPAGRVITYDPTKPWQTTVTGVDLTSQAGGSQTCVIWALRSTIPSDLDARKKWLPGASAETSFSGNTRTRERISAFLATNATFNGSGQITALTAPPSTDYFPILKVTAWPAGVPTVGTISMWDGTFTGGLVGDIPTRMDALASAPNLGLILLYLRQGLSYILDNTGGDNWVEAAANPYSGLKQLDDDITAVNADIATLEARTLNVVVAAFSMDKSSGSWAFLYPGTSTTVGISGFTVPATGRFTFTVTAARMVAGGGTITELTGVTVTLINTGTGSAPTVTPTPTVDITNASTGTFNVNFWSGGSLTDPDVDGFSVVVTGY